nr:hypothetical protein [Brucella intermedia]
MPEEPSSLLVDRSDHYLTGKPVTVSLVLSDATWAALIRSTAELYSRGDGRAMPFRDKVELFFQDLVYERVLIEDLADAAADDVGDEFPF